eukprot:scaffold5628_cov148-Prasinococcus_capsulatus_cf.AAC.1
MPSIIWRWALGRSEPVRPAGRETRPTQRKTSTFLGDPCRDPNGGPPPQSWCDARTQLNDRS